LRSRHSRAADELGESPHHVGIIVESVSAAVAEAEAAGYEVVQSGSGIGPRRDGSWAYIDTTRALGLMIEAVEPPQHARGRVRLAARVCGFVCAVVSFRLRMTVPTVR
jgi:hypothetical protein